ncbi:MAG: Maf family protein [Candidatus Babeliales bacterium]|nr:Maf family protein [Candidatus Babeliales bacterium]
MTLMSHIKKVLLLGSKSQSRQILLNEAKIPFRLIEQDVDETECDWALPLEQVVESIAIHKMNHLIMPQGSEGDVEFVLTADTLSQDHEGVIHGKPDDRADAVAKIKAARNGSRLVTAFCLERKRFTSGAWQTETRVVQCVSAEYVFNIPDAWVDIYLDNSIALNVSNAIAIEGFGAPFLKTISGSYSTIVGLPLYELRQALEQLGFFNF